MSKTFSIPLGIIVFFSSFSPILHTQAQTPFIRSCTQGQSREPFDQTVEDIILRTQNLDEEFRDSFDDSGLENIEEGFDLFVERGIFSRRDANQIKESTIRLFEKYLDLIEPFTEELNDTFRPVLEVTKYYSRGELQEAINKAEELPNLSVKLEEQLESIRFIEDEIVLESRDYQELISRAFLRSPFGRQLSESQRQQLRRQIQGDQDRIRRNIRNSLLTQTVALYAASYAMIGNIYISIGDAERALTYLEQSFSLSQQLPDQLIQGQTIKASILNDIGSAFKSLNLNDKALEVYKISLDVSINTRDPINAAYALQGIGSTHVQAKEYETALSYYSQALDIAESESVCDDILESSILSSIGSIYFEIGELQSSLSYLLNAQELFETKVGIPWFRIDTLTYLGLTYRDTNQSSKAIESLEEAMGFILQLRGGLLKSDRDIFLKSKETSTILVDSLIRQNRFEEAYEWVNRSTTADLIDYTRLLNARVADSEAQQLIEDWNQKNQQLQFLKQQLHEYFSEELSRQIRELEIEVNRDAEFIAAQFPQIAELFETTPADINALRASIPEGTLIVQPVPLTNINNVPDTIAFFLLSKDQPIIVKQVPINPQELEILVTQYRQQLQNWRDSGYSSSQENLYDLLIRPVEAEITDISPNQLSFVLAGRLRYIPLETLYDKQAEKYLIEKYPINYLTRLSTRSLSLAPSQNETALRSGVLAIGNPVPFPPQNLSGAEEEASIIAESIPGSELLLREDATLDAFRIQAPRFSFLHLATHGCFDPKGCPQLKMQPNTLLFSDNQYHITDAALLGLSNTELIILSACQTAQEANADGEEISGLAYLFERAGARAVIASLWNTPDEKTSNIMVQFYQNLKNGMTKTEALRQAKLRYVDEHPFFWAPLVLIGDAR